jgi:hypothetical protein
MHNATIAPPPPRLSTTYTPTLNPFVQSAVYVYSTQKTLVIVANNTIALIAYANAIM